ncbi:hypothetical protein TRIUR3_20533 [Triticum urartu]|uniref:Uncharacterized protein n=1 Tax=Triticum urartu TaxID=4572 RepID=M8A107_TRIUA|nr:hypothetical protein TRIUR3_20533 [Triticum urartu]
MLSSAPDLDGGPGPRRAVGWSRHLRSLVRHEVSADAGSAARWLMSRGFMRSSAQISLSLAALLICEGQDEVAVAVQERSAWPRWVAVGGGGAGDVLAVGCGEDCRSVAVGSGALFRSCRGILAQDHPYLASLLARVDHDEQ